MLVNPRSKWILIAALAGVLMAAGCSGPLVTTEDDAADEPDPTATDEPTTRTVQGYKIQVYSSPEKDEADSRVAQAVDWWGDVPPSQRPQHLSSNDLPIDIKWQQPYYRVRLGNFATRSEADNALSLVKQEFPDAFIVPDTVTITR